MPALTIWEGPTRTRFGLLLGLGAPRFFRVHLGAGGVVGAIVAVLDCIVAIVRACDVLLRVLYRRVTCFARVVSVIAVVTGGIGVVVEGGGSQLCPCLCWKRTPKTCQFPCQPICLLTAFLLALSLY